MDFTNGLGVAIAVIGGVILLSMIAVYKGGQGATLRDRLLNSPGFSPLLILHYFLPYGLIILCVFMDIMSQLPQGVFGVVIGVGMMLLNSLLSGFVNQPDLLPNDLCEIPGLKSWSSKFVPQSLLFTTTVVTYLAAFVTSSRVSPVNIASSLPATVTSSTPSASVRVGATWGLAVSVILVQAIGIGSTPGCLANMGLPGSIPLPPIASIFAAIALGMLGGGIAGWQLAQLPITQPNYTVTGLLGPGGKGPGSTRGGVASKPSFIKESFQLGAGLGEVPVPTSEADPTQISNAATSTSGTGANSADSSDQFVCEAYKNGQLVTSTLVG